MKVCLLSTSYPHIDDPIPGSFVRSMALALAAQGHHIVVLCAHCPNSIPVRDEHIEVQTVRYAPSSWETLFYGAGAPERLAALDPKALFGAANFPLAQAFFLRRTLSDCDALVSHFVLPCSLIGGLVRKQLPHLAIAHGTDGLLLAKTPAFFQEFLLSRCDYLWCTHEALRQRLSASVREDPRVFVRPLGYAQSPTKADSSEIRASLGIAPHETMLLFVGRITKLKGVDLLLKACLPPIEGLHVVLAGDGSEAGALRSFSSSHRFVHWLGAVTPEHRDALLRAADLFVLPSRKLPDGRTEGAPVALMEAMGMGLPCVVSALEGPSELAGSTGVLVPPEDVSALRDAIIQLHNTPSLRVSLGNSARERAAAWEWNEQARWLETLLTQRCTG